MTTSLGPVLLDRKPAASSAQVQLQHLVLLGLSCIGLLDRHRPSLNLTDHLQRHHLFFFGSGELQFPVTVNSFVLWLLYLLSEPNFLLVTIFFSYCELHCPSPVIRSLRVSATTCGASLLSRIATFLVFISCAPLLLAGSPSAPLIRLGKIDDSSNHRLPHPTCSGCCCLDGEVLWLYGVSNIVFSGQP